MKSGYVAILGRPNAGKSTLLNQVMNSELSVVTSKAQTTRERLFGILSDPQQGQMILVDTPGIHRAKTGGINEFMVKEARESVSDGAASVIWYVVAPDSKIEIENAVLESIPAPGREPLHVFILLNKADRLGAPGRQAASLLLEKLTEELKIKGHDVSPYWISALHNEGVDELLEDTWKLLPEGPAHYPDEDQLSDRPTRYFAGERIREQLFLQLGEELPYSCAVRVDKFEENKKPLRIEATILVERDSQKGMVIGKGGQKIKMIGIEARKSLSKFLGQEEIFLGLKVDVLKNWTRDKDALRKLGYVTQRP